jgi:hypothetical protein
MSEDKQPPSKVFVRRRHMPEAQPITTNAIAEERDLSTELVPQSDPRAASAVNGSHSSKAAVKVARN